MPRIRSVKPEFWADDDVTDCSPLARLLFIGLWNFADDEGRLYDKPRQISAQVFPRNPDIPVAELLDELMSVGLVQRWELPNGRNVLIVRNFRVHQRPQHPTPSKIDLSGAAPAVDSTFTSPHESARNHPSSHHGEVRSGTGKEELHSESLKIVSPHDDSRDLMSTPVGDAVFTVCEIASPMTRTGKRAFDTAVHDLISIGATPDDVIERGHRFRTTWPSASLTPSALARRWSEIPTGTGNNVVLANFARNVNDGIS